MAMIFFVMNEWMKWNEKFIGCIRFSIFSSTTATIDMANHLEQQQQSFSFLLWFFWNWNFFFPVWQTQTKQFFSFSSPSSSICFHYYLWNHHCCCCRKTKILEFSWLKIIINFCCCCCCKNRYSFIHSFVIRYIFTIIKRVSN